MSLETPDRIRILQRKLYCKAKAEPEYRFYLLYDKVCRGDILFHAYQRAHANAGAPGVDGVTFEQIEARGLDAWLASLREELVSKTYRPAPVRRVMIPKPGRRTRHPDHTGSGGSDRRQARAGTDLRGGFRRGCTQLPSRSQCDRRDQGSAPVGLTGL